MRPTKMRHCGLRVFGFVDVSIRFSVQKHHNGKNGLLSTTDYDSTMISFIYSTDSIQRAEHARLLVGRIDFRLT
jgi:hypothetical protein